MQISFRISLVYLESEGEIFIVLVFDVDWNSRAVFLIKFGIPCSYFQRANRD